MDIFFCISDRREEILTTRGNNEGQLETRGVLLDASFLRDVTSLTNERRKMCKWKWWKGT